MICRQDYKATSIIFPAHLRKLSSTARVSCRVHFFVGVLREAKHARQRRCLRDWLLADPSKGGRGYVEFSFFLTGPRHPPFAGTISRMNGEEGDAKQGISREGPLRSIASPPFAG